MRITARLLGLLMFLVGIVGLVGLIYPGLIVEAISVFSAPEQGTYYKIVPTTGSEFFSLLFVAFGAVLVYLSRTPSKSGAK